MCLSVIFSGVIHVCGINEQSDKQKKQYPAKFSYQKLNHKVFHTLNIIKAESMKLF